MKKEVEEEEVRRAPEVIRPEKNLSTRDESLATTLVRRLLPGKLPLLLQQAKEAPTFGLKMCTFLDRNEQA
jgi:hypothetical protein